MNDRRADRQYAHVGEIITVLTSQLCFWFPYCGISTTSCLYFKGCLCQLCISCMGTNQKGAWRYLPLTFSSAWIPTFWQPILIERIDFVMWTFCHWGLGDFKGNINAANLIVVMWTCDLETPRRLATPQNFMRRTINYTITKVWHL